MSEYRYRYKLEPYKGPHTRYDCPNCRKRKTFIRYIDTETGEHLGTKVGKCNRESNCDYHYTPKQYFQDNKPLFDTQQTKAYKPRPVPVPQLKPVSFIPVEVFKASLNLKAYETNHFVQFLRGRFGDKDASELVSRYYIATSKHWSGATVFWQRAEDGIRTGKIMLYNPDTGKRVKEKINWVHSVLKIESFNLKQCFFGQHLLRNNTSPVAIVESEKTAVIASVYLPQFIWLAVGGLTNLSVEYFKVLQGQTVILFPDLNGFEKWSDKAKEISRVFPSIRITVSDLLERKAPDEERRQGLDLADYLIRFNYRDFQQQQQPTPQPSAPEQPQQAEIEPVCAAAEKAEKSYPETLQCMIAKTPAIKILIDELELVIAPVPEFQPVAKNPEPETPKPENWTDEITELENYFAGITLPTGAVKINSCTTITDVALFLKWYFASVKANNGKRHALPDLNRLQELKQYLTLNSN